MWHSLVTHPSVHVFGWFKCAIFFIFSLSLSMFTVRWLRSVVWDWWQSLRWMHAAKFGSLIKELVLLMAIVALFCSRRSAGQFIWSHCLCWQGYKLTFHPVYFHLSSRLFFFLFCFFLWKIRYTAAHTLDLYSEVAAICRPPLQLAPSEIGSFKKTQTPATGYIISVFKVCMCIISASSGHCCYMSYTEKKPRGFFNSKFII